MAKEYKSKTCNQSRAGSTDDNDGARTQFFVRSLRVYRVRLYKRLGCDIGINEQKVDFKINTGAECNVITASK